MSDKQIPGLPEGITEDLAVETVVAMQNFIKATRSLVDMMDKLEAASPVLGDGERHKQSELLGMVKDLEDEINVMASIPELQHLLKEFTLGD